MGVLASFSAWVQFFVSGVTWSIRASSVALVWRLETAAWRHGESSLLCSRWIRCSVILRLWHGLRLLPMVGSEVSVQWTGARWRAQLRGVPESSEIQEMFKRERRARALARRFKLSVFGHRPQAAGPIRASVRGGAPPMSRLSGVEFSDPTFHSFRGRYKLTGFICLFSHTWC